MPLQLQYFAIANEATPSTIDCSALTINAL